MTAPSGRDAVFVVGMGRSGSSALARILGLCGGELPRRLLPPNFANPRGYWEPLRALELNDAFLAAHESSWYDGSLALQTGRTGAVERRRFVDAIAAFFASEYEAAATAVVKEPRITALLPYWIEGAHRAGRSVKFVHVLRDPAAVAASLAQRDGLCADHAFALWLKYTLIAERDTRGAPRVVAGFDELLADWETVVGGCIGALPLGASIDDRVRDAVAAFLVPELRHHRGRAAEGAVRTPRLAEWAARTLAAMRPDGKAEPDARELDAVLDDYLASRLPLQFRLKSTIAAR
ncbi:MAG TPA: sulfotransferase [Dongiaceae bacterium]|nr:sulfotransferase [Dongiaceae bacterium]